MVAVRHLVVRVLADRDNKLVTGPLCLELELALLFLCLLHFDKGSDLTNLVVAMSIEVKAPLLGHPQLHEVVIERFLGDLDLGSCLLEGHLDKDAVTVEASV